MEINSQFLIFRLNLTSELWLRFMDEKSRFFRLDLTKKIILRLNN